MSKTCSALQFQPQHMSASSSRLLSSWSVEYSGLESSPNSKEGSSIGDVLDLDAAEPKVQSESLPILMHHCQKEHRTVDLVACFALHFGAAASPSELFKIRLLVMSVPYPE